MIFSAWQFIFVFLPVTVAGFFLIPERYGTARKWWLTLASFYFYGYWKVDYVPLLLGSILFNYAVGESMVRLRNPQQRWWILLAGVGGNLAVLGYFKYTDFAVNLFADFFTGQPDGEPITFNIILPLAISFFTFTQISYIVDVYRDEAKHYKFLDYALFVVFFPHLIAGPIVRHWEIIPQLTGKLLKLKFRNVATGGALFFIGLFKKVLFADPLGGYVDPLFAASAAGTVLTPLDAWIATLGFGLQIYFDFSAYSDMAIGLARIFDVKFPVNFNSPYKARNVMEFWSRWHITLTRFLREYVYFPLGGNRKGKGRQAFNGVATMFLSGLWHGAGLTFIVWGLLHGFYLIVAHTWSRVCVSLGWKGEGWWAKAGAVVLTFVAVHVGWVYFRAESLAQANEIVASLFGFNGFSIPQGIVSSVREVQHAADWAGIAVVPNAADFGHGYALVQILLLIIICWTLPNSQQLLTLYRPTLERVRPQGRCVLKLNLLTGALAGIFFFLVIRHYFLAPANTFIYFDF